MDFYRAKEHLMQRLETELSPQHYYHGSYHTVDVINAVEQIAKNENIKGDDLIILKTAALFHDAGFLYKNDSNETIACEISRETLGEFEYNNRQIEIICRIIMATALPHKPKNILEDIICDADLDYIGIDETTYATHSERLRSELAEFGLSMNNTEWLEMQIKFLESHKFFTKTNIESREPMKQIILTKLKKQLAELN